MIKMKQRLEFIDCLRGFTMTLVVYGHLLTFSYGIQGDHFLGSFLLIFRMPLFFFVSGFFSYLVSDCRGYYQKFKNRLYGQFIPTIFTLALFELWTGNLKFSGYLSYAKDGYWFTFVMFMMFSLYAVVAGILDNYKVHRRFKLFIYLAIAIVTYGINKVYADSSNFLWNLFSMRHLTYYTCFFLFGVIAKMYYDGFESIIANEKVISLFVVVLVLLMYSPVKIPIALLGFLGIVIVYRIFWYYSDFFSSKTLIGRVMSYVGKNTLPIYFLHYFAFKYLNLSNMAHYLIENNMEMLGVVATFVLSILLVAMCLGVQKIIEVYRPIYVLMFGPKKG